MTDSETKSSTETGAKPNLQLGPPPAGALQKRPASSAGIGSGTGIFLILLLVANLAIGVTLLRRGTTREPIEDKNSSSAGGLAGASTGQGLESLAIELEERSLWRPAAEEWLAVALKAPDQTQKANAYFRSGNLFEKARDHERAAASYVAADELLAQGTNDALKAKIGLRLTDCFRVLGLSGELSRELARRTQKGVPDAGVTKVIAHVNGDPLTESDLDRLIEGQVDQMMSMRGSAADPQERENILRQFHGPEQRERILQQLIQQEVLVRKGRESGMDRSEEFLNRLRQIERGLLEDLVLQKEIGAKLSVTPQDLKNYYEANKTKFMAQASARLLVIEFKSVGDAEKEHQQLVNMTEETFRKAVQEKSIHQETRDSSGEISESYTKGASILGLPPAPALDAFVFKKDMERVSSPLQIGTRFFLFYIKSRELERQQAFEEVQEMIQYQYANEKQRELTEALVKDLQGRYKVQIESDPVKSTTKKDADK